MNAIRTLNDLQQALDSEHSWRLKELAALKGAARRPQSLSEDTIVRAGVALAYAHWEGFVKAACTAYVDYVASTRMACNELITPFAVLALRAKLHIIPETKSADLAGSTLEFVRDQLQHRAFFTGKEAISTEANLSSTVLRQILGSIGISAVRYEARFNFIDETLLRNRHLVAHGEDLVLDRFGWETVADDTLLLLRWIKDDVQNAASTKAFIRQKP